MMSARVAAGTYRKFCTGLALEEVVFSLLMSTNVLVSGVQRVSIS